MLQVPELKRAMGFGNAFVMRHGARRDKIKILGNAVSPPVICSILQGMCLDALSPSKKVLYSRRDTDTAIFDKVAA